MAAQTVSTDLNLDDASISGLLNGETVTVNTNATLTCDSDNRWSQQAAVVGNLSINAVSGGKRKIDATKVWQVPFTASSGNVPALGTVNVQDCTGVTSGATGDYLGIWATGEMIPRTAGGAMPADGYVKLRSKVGTFDATSETINLPGGATITSAGPGKRSWINFVANYQGTSNIPRLGTDDGEGTWYDLGTTNGLNNQEFDYPFLDVCNAIEVETAPGSGVYDIFRQAGGRWVSATATLDTDVRGRYFGQRAENVTGSTTNGSAVVTTTATAELIVGMPINASAGFSNLAMYIVSINPGVSFTVSANSNAPGTGRTFTTWKSKLTLARTGTTTQGYLPPSGCKVRCANLKLSTSISPWAGNILPTTLADRHEWVTTSAGQIIMDTVDSGWYANFSAPYSVDLRRVAQSINISVANVATTTYIERCSVSYENASVSTGLSASNCYGGGEIKECVLARHNSAFMGNSAAAFNDCSDFTITDCIFVLGGTSLTSRLRGNADIRAVTMTRCFRFNFIRPTMITGRFAVIGCVDINILDPRFADLERGATPGPANALTGAITVDTGSVNVYGEGFSNYGGLANVHPFYNILIFASGDNNVEWRNIGTPAAPYNCGTTNPCRRVVTASTTVGLTMRRCYVMNTATDFGSISNTVQGCELVDCWADSNDTNAFLGVNQTNKGCRWTNSVVGQSAVYGSHWEHAWTSTTEGRLVLKCNEPTTVSADQFTITAGTPRFTSTGNIAMPILGDQFIAESPFFALGVTAGAATAPTLTGTNTGNFSYEFQYDNGSGYNDTWLTLDSGNWSGMTGITAAIGVRVKLRVTTTTADDTNALTYIRMGTVTNATDQQIQYPVPVIQNSGVVSGLLAGSRVIVYNETEDTVVYDDIVAGTSLVLSYVEGSDFTEGDLVRVYHVWYNSVDGSSATKKARITATAGATGWSVLAEPETCTTYGAYYTTFSVTGQAVYASGDFIRDMVNLQIDLDDADDRWYAHRLFMFDKYDLWFNSGRREVFGRITAADAGNINLGGLDLDNLNVNTAYQDDNINVFNDDGLLPVQNPTTGGGGITMWSGGKVLTTSTGGIAPSEAQIKSWVRAELATEMARIDAAITTRATAADQTAIKTKTDALAFTVAGQVDANIQSMNNAEVIGIGTAGDAWRGVGVPP